MHKFSKWEQRSQSRCVCSPVRLCITAFACLCSATSVFAQSPEIPAIKVAKPPSIDGIIDPAEWAGVTPIEGGYDEQTGAKAPEKTEYWFAYDDKFVYFAARAFDSQPQTIRSQEYRTNVSMQGDDFVGIFLDPFGQVNGPSNQFEINPRGATNLRVAGGRAAKREWLGEILAKGRITPEGYEVEARIPWTLMRLPASGKRDMRIGAYRVMPRLGRAYLITDISGGNGERIPTWKSVELPNIQTDRSIKLLPYTYLGWDKDQGGLFNSGLDLKTTTNSGIDIIGSINPDFRNIENQVLSLDFSYFERLAGESRPFFLEGQNFFQTSRDAPLFSSQRIRNFDVGFKAFGKITDKTTFAFLDTMDFNRQNDFVGIVRHGFDNRTTLNVAVADRNARDAVGGGPKRVHNLGTFFSFGTGRGPVDFFAQYEPTKDSIDGNGSRTNTGFKYGAKGLSGTVEYTEVSPQFLPRLGFAPERGFRGVSANLGLGKQFSKGPLLDAYFFVDAEFLNQWRGSAAYRRQGTVYGQIGLRNNTSLETSAFYREFLGFKDRLYSVELNFPRNDPYRNWSIEYDFGNLAGRNYTSIEPQIAYRPYRNLQLSLSHQQVKHFTTLSQTILSGAYELNAYDSVVGRALQNGRDTNAYVAYRRTGNTGNEYFLIIGDPNARTFRASIVLKAVFPLSWKM